ncbi:Ig-like domain-containing protein [Sporosarcina sp. GW1-11]|uniref:Ig-like domain-containing protein n=1 Tax=Sporosarcina sp. GW1-11 TaxID=2899126 RepID=UPI00294D016C|nr:Ig-like domain-containing protein [Sporosarcina sp. GW1-11]MDV6378753.1 Ig-like domain-containing protein [Sporosarcina sp. GW1-11]
MRLRILATLVCISFLLSGLFTTHTTLAATSQPVTDPMKPWTITFTKDVSNQTANLERISVQSKGKKLSLSLSADSDKVIVKPKNPYLFGERYTLTIPASFQSATGKMLNQAVTKEFEITGEYIKDVSATMNPFATSISVKVLPEVAYASYSINSGSPIKLLRSGVDSFSKGQIGLLRGDLLTIRVSNELERVIETQYYEVK